MSELVPHICLHMLVVDHDPLERDFAASLARSHGHIVEEAKNRQETLSKAHHTLFDLILIELILPGHDGFEIARAIRNTLPETRRSVPIMALTATQKAHDVWSCFQAGMSNFLPKPLTSNKLMSISNVYQIMRRYRMS